MAVSMLLPATVDLRDGDQTWTVFIVSAILTVVICGLVTLATPGAVPRFSTRLGFLLTSALWLTAALVGSIPIYLSSLELSFAAAFFESMSGITTTGSTVISGLDDLSRSLLLWRSMLQWIGGVGFVGLGLLILPSLRVGGIQLFHLESSEKSDKILPRVTQIAAGIIIAYVVLTILCMASYLLSGMTTFDAVNHAMTTLATGGYSTHDASMGFYSENMNVLLVSTVFMFFAALPFIVYVKMVVGNLRLSLADPQIFLFFTLVAAMSFALAISLSVTRDLNFGEALIRSAFNLVSIITTTGYASEDYSLWGAAAVGIFFVATFLGGCAGSTAGGLKTNRLILLWQFARVRFSRLVTPNAVTKVKYGQASIADKTAETAVLFFGLFMASLFIGTAVLLALGLDLVTAITGALTALTNVGPGFGDIIGPAGNFSAISEGALWVLSFLMLLGRLEIITVLMLFTTSFWSR
ncbi:TrkH family potassium uptake protein [Phyllobacterium sp. K27]